MLLAISLRAQAFPLKKTVSRQFIISVNLSLYLIARTCCIMKRARESPERRDRDKHRDHGHERHLSDYKSVITVLSFLYLALMPGGSAVGIAGSKKMSREAEKEMRNVLELITAQAPLTFR